MIFERLRFIRNLSHGHDVRCFVTFIKTYLEYNQLPLQTSDITEFCMNQYKLSRCILFLYKNHDENKNDKRLLNSAISSINTAGREKIITVTFMVPRSTVLIILNSYLLLVRCYRNHHHQIFFARLIH